MEKITLHQVTFKWAHVLPFSIQKFTLSKKLFDSKKKIVSLHLFKCLLATNYVGSRRSLSYRNQGGLNGFAPVVFGNRLEFFLRDLSFRKMGIFHLRTQFLNFESKFLKIFQTRLIFYLIVLRLPLNGLLLWKVSSAEFVYCKMFVALFVRVNGVLTGGLVKKR